MCREESGSAALSKGCAAIKSTAGATRCGQCWTQWRARTACRVSRCGSAARNGDSAAIKGGAWRVELLHAGRPVEGRAAPVAAKSVDDRGCPVAPSAMEGGDWRVALSCGMLAGRGPGDTGGGRGATASRAASSVGAVPA